MAACNCRIFVSLTWMMLAAHSFAQSRELGDVWGRWSFVIGDWEGIGSGDPGKGAGRFSFAPDLDRKILVRKNFSEYPSKPGERTGIRHRDLMIVYPDDERSAFRAVYFDNEGHVIHYLVTFPAKQPAVTFESDLKPGVPRYRLDYEMESDNTLLITFSIALPGQAYKTYVQGKSKRIN